MYKDIGSSVGKEKVDREVTERYAGFGLASRSSRLSAWSPSVPAGPSLLTMGVAENLARVRARVDDACRRVGRGAE